MGLTYRPEIDGLRALAVLPVVLFHLSVPYFDGGYIGVDVFFVISGFLITSLIVAEEKRHSFSVLSFYERRIRRILPALFAVLLLSTAAATLLFMPEDLRDYAQSVFATAAFSSNILFWLEAGYFDAPAVSKPLLHTWSLAVEEQFYIIFPLLLVWLLRCHARTLRTWLSLVALISFAMSAYGVSYAPSATFYLLPTRAWELLLGALLVFLPQPQFLRPTVANCVAAAGLAFILISIFSYGAQTRFPGVAAALPCAGAAFVIYGTGGRPNMCARILSATPLVAIGLCSYSLYLWHWPIIVFSKYYLQRNFEPLDMVIVLIVSSFCAWVSWRYVELPFRGRRSRFSRPTVFRLAAASICVILTAGVLGHVLRGLPGRLPDRVQQLAAGARDRDERTTSCHTSSPHRVLSGDLCTLGGSKDTVQFLVWGDSHAVALMPAFEMLASRHRVTGRIASYTGCPPLLGIRRADRDLTHECSEFNAAVASYIRTNRIADVVLVARWSAMPSAYLTRLTPPDHR